MPLIINSPFILPPAEGSGIGLLGAGIVSGPALTANTQRWTMSNDSVVGSTALTGNLLEVGATSNGTVAHFCFGNQDLNYNSGSGTDYMDRYVYSTEARTQPVSNLNGTVRMGPACFNSPTYGWYVGGINSGVGYVTSNLKVSHSSDTQFNDSTIATGTEAAAGLADGTSGFILGGNTGTAITAIQKINLAIGGWSAVSAVLSVARSIFSGDGNGTFGVVGGGYTGSANVSTVDKFTFGTETVSSAASLSLTKNGVNAMGNTVKVVFAGTNAANGTSDKFLFASETMSSTTTLTSPQIRGGATCSANGGL